MKNLQSPNFAQPLIMQTIIVGDIFTQLFCCGPTVTQTLLETFSHNRFVVANCHANVVGDISRNCFVVANCHTTVVQKSRKICKVQILLSCWVVPKRYKSESKSQTLVQLLGGAEDVQVRIQVTNVGAIAGWCRSGTSQNPSHKCWCNCWVVPERYKSESKSQTLVQLLGGAGAVQVRMPVRVPKRYKSESKSECRSGTSQNASQNVSFLQRRKVMTSYYVIIT
jgi:hypothetical protein